jgi:hypothetical protein
VGPVTRIIPVGEVLEIDLALEGFIPSESMPSMACEDREYADDLSPNRVGSGDAEVDGASLRKASSDAAVLRHAAFRRCRDAT